MRGNQRQGNNDKIVLGLKEVVRRRQSAHQVDGVVIEKQEMLLEEIYIFLRLVNQFIDEHTVSCSYDQIYPVFLFTPAAQNLIADLHLLIVLYILLYFCYLERTCASYRQYCMFLVYSNCVNAVDSFQAVGYL